MVLGLSQTTSSRVLFINVTRATFMNRRLLGAKKVSLLHSFSRAMEFLSIMFSLVPYVMVIWV